MLDIKRIRNNITQHYKKQKEDKEREHAANNAYSKYYQDPRWKNLRSWYRNIHPLCECCLKMGYAVPGEQVHHMHKFSAGLTEEAKWNLLLSPANLCHLCCSCHKAIHKIMKQQNVDYVTLDELVKYQQNLNKCIK